MADQTAVRTPFVGLIEFKFTTTKTTQCFEWIGSKKPLLPITDVYLAMFLAERSHLNDYGRVIVGATYLVCKDGSVSSPELDVVVGKPPASARWALVDGRLHSPVCTDLPWDMSISDTEHLDMALALITDNREAAMAVVSASSHKGRIDHALMVDDEDDAKLEAKLVELRDWGRYHHLGD